MPKHKTLPQFKNYEEAAEWLDSHSTADLEATEVAFEVTSPLTIQILDSLSEVEKTIVVEKELSQQIRHIADREGLSPQALVHKWLLEKVEKILEAK